MDRKPVLLVSAALLLSFALVMCDDGGEGGDKDTTGTQENSAPEGIAESSVAIDISGQDDRGQAIAIQNGNVVLCGTTQTSTGSDSFVCRLNSEGALDPTFGVNGISVVSASNKTDDCFMAIQVDYQGRLCVAGWVDDDGGNRMGMVCRLNPDGGFDTTFGNGGIVKMPIGEATKDPTLNKEVGMYGCALPDGTGNYMVAAGAAISGGKAAMIVVQVSETGLDPSFGENGVVWAQFGSGSRSGAKTLAVASDGRIVVGGWAVPPLAPLGTEAAFIVLNPDGKLNVQKTTDMGIGGWDDIYGIACHGTKVVMVGSSSDPGGANRHFACARFTLEGDPDPAFGTDGKAVYLTDSGSRDEWKSVAVGPAGEYYAVGTSKVSTLESYINVACLNDDGTFRTSFGPSGDGLLNISIGQRPSAGYGCRLQDGRLYVVGTVGQETSNPDVGIAVVR